MEISYLSLTPAEREQARAARQLVAARFVEDPGSVSLVVMTTHGPGTAVPLPPAVVLHLLDVLELLATGTYLRVVPIDAELTSSQVAEILGCSRPTAVKLMSDGALPYRFQGARRRVRLADLMTYKDRRDSRE